MPRKKQIEEEQVDVEVSAFGETFEGFETLDSAFAILSASSGAPALSGLAAIIGREYTGPHGSWENHVRKINQGMI